jgi:ferredoxin--NADP+ reductase
MTTADDKFYHARITKRVDFSPELWMFRIQSDGEFNFVPGQYATLGVEIDGGK